MMSSDWNSEKVYLKNVKEQIEMELFYFFVMKTEYFKKTNVRQSFCRRLLPSAPNPANYVIKVCKCD